MVLYYNITLSVNKKAKKGINMKNQKVIARAQQYCLANREKFTLPRRRVLEVLVSQPGALGAYDIIKALSDTGNEVNPPTVYRAIDFWVKHGFAHKIETLKAYIACCNQHPHQHSIMMVCDRCQKIKEISLKSLPQQLKTILKECQFNLAKSIMEITGCCQDCHDH